MEDYIIQLKNLTKVYGNKTVVKNINLDIKKGEFVTILGPSGCGKTTTLRMIAGFEQPTSGQIFFDGKDIAGLPPYKRAVNTVFQKYALFPHLNVFNNVAFGLKLKKVEQTLKDKNGQDYTKLVNLKNSLVDQIIYDKDRKPTGETKKVKYKSAYEYREVQSKKFVKVNLYKEYLEKAKAQGLTNIKPENTLVDQVIYNSDHTSSGKTKKVEYKDAYAYRAEVTKKVKKIKLYKEFIDKKVKNALKMVGLSDYEDRNVNSLSGGQQQRVAIARAIINEPKILLLDEPLGALDLKMRQEMQLELKEMHKKLGITFIYVTHDQEEALTMSDTIIVMRDGKIMQKGSPMEIYNEPVNSYVADFIGEANIFDGVMLKDKLVKFCGVEVECVDTGFGKYEPIEVVIRPEDWIVKKPGQGSFDGVINSSMFRGVHYEASCTCNGYEFIIHSTKEYKVGQAVSLSVDPFDIQIMKIEVRTNIVPVTFKSENTFDLYGDVYEFDPIKFFGTDYNPDDYVNKDGTVSFSFDDVDMEDDEWNAPLSANVESMIYKGKNYFVTLRTDNNKHIFANTEYLWDDGDRIGIKIQPYAFNFEGFVTPEEVKKLLKDKYEIKDECVIKEVIDK